MHPPAVQTRSNGNVFSFTSANISSNSGDLFLSPRPRNAVAATFAKSSVRAHLAQQVDEVPLVLSSAFDAGAAPLDIAVAPCAACGVPEGPCP
jgi:hypothetical protein